MTQNVKDLNYIQDEMDQIISLIKLNIYRRSSFRPKRELKESDYYEIIFRKLMTFF